MQNKHFDGNCSRQHCNYCNILVTVLEDSQSQRLECYPHWLLEKCVHSKKKTFSFPCIVR